MWDVVAFDEVVGITFKDKDGVQIMKDYMASGSFSRGRDSIEAKASMVFVGNINQSVETLVKTSHLLAPFLREGYITKATAKHSFYIDQAKALIRE
ncbi:BREX system Lon protease-like protein BrxL, partial [Klebsiella pneumoniae]